MSNLLWVIQTDLDRIENQREQEQLIDALERLDQEYQRVKVADYETDPVIDHDGPIVVHGSIMLSKIATAKGWSPGSGFNDNFNYLAWYDRLRPHLLNKDVVFGTLDNIRPALPEFFLRPLSDEKTFTGRVVKLDEYDAWRSDLPGGTPVLYGATRFPGMEHRHYIIDRQVVASSRYKLNGVMNVDEGVDPFVHAYAQSIASEWCPGWAWVLDTYLLGDEIGIVELGCLTHAGLYAANIPRIVWAIIEYVESRRG